MTTARPMACSTVLQSATDASSALQSMVCPVDPPNPTPANALVATTCSTKLRTSSNDSKSKDAKAEAGPEGNDSSTRRELRGSIADGRLSGCRPFVECVV